MMEREKVNIVIPVYNRARLIGRCLDSVLAQTWRPLRLIVVDNNSTDRSAAEVTAWTHSNRVHVEDETPVPDTDSEVTLKLMKETKPGASAARNRGLGAVDSEHVIFFDSDDEMMPTLVEQAMTAIGDADLVCWKAETLQLDGTRTLKPFHHDNLLKRQMYNGLLSTQTYMARTELMRRVGEWEEEATVWNDWEIGIRIAMTGIRAVMLPEILVRIHAQAESITGRRFSDRAGAWEKTLDIVERKVVAAAAGRPKSETTRITDMLDYRRVILAAHYSREGSRELSESLLNCGVNRQGRPWWRRQLLRLLYHYTVLGGRGAYYAWRR